MLFRSISLSLSFVPIQNSRIPRAQLPPALENVAVVIPPICRASGTKVLTRHPKNRGTTIIPAGTLLKKFIIICTPTSCLYLSCTVSTFHFFFCFSFLSSFLLSGLPFLMATWMRKSPQSLLLHCENVQLFFSKRCLYIHIVYPIIGFAKNEKYLTLT